MVVHRSPMSGSRVMPCCGRTLFEVAMTDRMTIDEKQVTCSTRAPLVVVKDAFERKRREPQRLDAEDVSVPVTSDDVWKVEPEVQVKVPEPEEPQPLLAYPETIPISELKVEPVADVLIRSMAQSIMKDGLHRPLLVDVKGNLIDGRRRLAALNQLRWSYVPVLTIDLELLRASSRDDNRKHLAGILPSGLVRIGEKIEAIERPLAIERQQEGRIRRQPRIKKDYKMVVRDIVGDALGTSGQTYRKMREIIRAADAEPEIHGDLVIALDESCRTERVFKVLRRRQGLDEEQKSVIVPPPSKSAVKTTRGRPPREVVWNILNSLTVMTDTLDSINLDRIDPAEAAGFATDLNPLIAALRRARTRLVERGEADGRS